MQLYPAIDIRAGQCVRLAQGSFQEVTVYHKDPVAVARQWVREGATFLHLVDLDGALAGAPMNQQVISTIARELKIPVQIGGGIRTLQAIADLLETGVKRVIIGTKAVQTPQFIKEVIQLFGADQIVVGVDAKDGLVAIEGWKEISSISALELCQQMKEYGVQHIVYTDIAKDGMLCGPNISYTKQLTEQTGLDIIASGGVSSMEDLKLLYESGINGAIIGKALYEQRLSLTNAIDLFQGVSDEII